MGNSEINLLKHVFLDCGRRPVCTQGEHAKHHTHWRCKVTVLLIHLWPHPICRLGRSDGNSGYPVKSWWMHRNTFQANEALWRKGPPPHKRENIFFTARFSIHLSLSELSVSGSLQVSMDVSWPVFILGELFFGRYPGPSVITVKRWGNENMAWLKGMFDGLLWHPRPGSFLGFSWWKRELACLSWKSLHKAKLV